MKHDLKYYVANFLWAAMLIGLGVIIVTNLTK